MAPSRRMERPGSRRPRCPPTARDLPAEASELRRFVHHQHPPGFPGGSHEGGGVQGAQAADVHHFHLDALLGQRGSHFQAARHHAPVADERQVAPRPLHLRAAQGQGVLLFGHRPLGPVQKLLLEEHHRVVVADRGFQQSLGVVGGGRDDHLEAGHVAHPGLHALRMLGRRAGPRAPGGAQHHGHGRLPAELVAHLGGLVGQLVHGDGEEVAEHDLHDRAHAGDGRAHRGPGDGRLADRGVAHRSSPNSWIIPAETPKAPP
jgi:hypothetical protein